MVNKNYDYAQLKAIQVATQIGMFKNDFLVIPNMSKEEIILKSEILNKDWQKSELDPRLSEDFKKRIDWHGCKEFLTELQQKYYR